MKKRPLLVIILLTFILINLPYLAGLMAGNDQNTFSGLILNPIDGYSYYAKMAQGYQGNWLFQLPFTAEPGPPVFLFFYYILLGHISRLVHLSIPLVYHLARIFGFLFLSVQLWKFIIHNLALKNISNVWCFLFIFFASGMGWIPLLMGYQSGDLVIPEAYPFYASLINPHFPLGIALFILILDELLKKDKTSYLKLIIATIAFAVIMPFGSVILCIVISVFWLFRKNADKKMLLPKLLLICIPATVIVGYQYYETIFHESLVIWNQQNITPTPPPWDILISFSPMIFFAFFSLRKWKESNHVPVQQIMMIWLAICLLMIFMPFPFQRRFMFSMAIPVSIIGLFWMNDLIENSQHAEQIKKLSFVFPLISIVLLIVISFFAVIGKSSYSFLSAGEVDLYNWISSLENNEVVLANPEIAVKIPGFTGHRVYYGHPYETVNAEEKLQNVEEWFACQSDIDLSKELLMNEKIDLVIIKQSEYDASCFDALAIVYENQEFILLGGN
jgi:hypothetical protein